MEPRILLFIQGAKGGGQELHLARPPGIALGNKEKAKAERPHLLTGTGYCQEVKLPLLLQKKTYCEITELSQSRTVLSSSGGHAKGMFGHTEQGIRWRTRRSLTILHRGIAP